MADIKNKATIKDGTVTVTSNEINIDEKILNVTIVKSTTFTGEWKSGDTIKWKFTIMNPNKTFTKTNLLFSDVLDTQTNYVSSTFKVNLVLATPVLSPPTISYTIPSIAPLGSATIEFDVLCS